MISENRQKQERREKGSSRTCFFEARRRPGPHRVLSVLLPGAPRVALGRVFTARMGPMGVTRVTFASQAVSWDPLRWEMESLKNRCVYW